MDRCFKRHCPVGLADLLDGYQAFELISEIDDQFLGSDLYDVALQ